MRIIPEENFLSYPKQAARIAAAAQQSTNCSSYNACFQEESYRLGRSSCLNFISDSSCACDLRM